MRMMRVPKLTGGVSVIVLAALITAGCSSGGELSTGAGGPRATTGSVPPPGTVILADSNGELAAESLGKIVATTPETTEAPTTTAPPTTAAPVFVPTTARPNVPGPTTPQTTQALPTPTLPTPQPVPGSTKPAPVPVSASVLTGDERAIFNAINSYRRSKGLPDLVLEQAALDAARKHTSVVQASGPVAIASILDAVNARYTQLTSISSQIPRTTDLVNNIELNARQISELPFTYIGIGTAGSNLVSSVIIVGS